MASGIYTGYVKALKRGQIDYQTDVFKVMLVTSVYVPDFETDDRRDDVTNEVVGAGYTAGGDVTTLTETDDTVNNRLDYAVADVDWPASSITARGAVIYVDKGASANDILCAYVDFGSDKSTIAGLFTFTASSPLRFQF